MSESSLTRKACNILHREHGAQILPVIGNRMAPSGWPDRYIAHPQWRGFVEFKLDTDLSAIQRAICKKLIVFARQPVHVVRWGGTPDLAGQLETIDKVCLARFVGVAEMLQRFSEYDDEMRRAVV